MFVDINDRCCAADGLFAVCASIVQLYYYKHQDTNQSYCSLDCLNDHMIYTHVLTIETSEGEESTEEQDNDE